MNLKLVEPSRRLPFKLILGWGVALIVVIWLASAIDWPAVLQALARLRVEWAALAVLAIALHTLARGLRWCALFLPARVPIEPALTAMLVGQTVNYWLPARLGDVPRIVWLGRRTQVSKSQIAGTLLVEKMWDALPLIAVLFLISLSADVPPELADPMRSVALLGGLAAAALTAISFSTDRISQLAARLTSDRSGAVRHRLNQILQGVLAGVRTMRLPSAVVRAVGWTAVAWALGATGNWLVFRALDLPAGWAAALLVSAALRVGISLAAAPAAIGVYEGAVVLCLSIFGISLNVALSYALVMHAIDVVVPLAMTAWLAAHDARRGERGRHEQ